MAEITKETAQFNNDLYKTYVSLGKRLRNEEILSTLNNGKAAIISGLLTEGELIRQIEDSLTEFIYGEQQTKIS